MASKVNICSMATTMLGANRVNDLDNPTTEEERLCVLWWDHCLNELLEEHDWKFARAYQPDLAVTTSPSEEYDHAYQKPNDCVLIRYLWDEEAGKRVTDSEFELQEDMILADLDTVNVVYTSNAVAVGKYPTYFVKALTYLLASYLAYKLTEGGKMHTAMKDDYKDALLTAIDRDCSQANYPVDPNDDSWLQAAGFSGTNSSEGA